MVTSPRQPAIHAAVPTTGTTSTTSTTSTTNSLGGPGTPGTNGSDHRMVLEQFVGTWCLDCHDQASAKGDLDLSAFEGLAARAVAGDAASDPALAASLLAEMRERLEARDMPPRDPRPSEEAYRQAIEAIRALAPRHEHAGRPGRVTARRLSRAEYANTIRDLIGVDLAIESMLPEDEVGHGFDNNGDVLTIPPLLLEKYVDVAERIAAAAVHDPLDDQPQRMRRDGGGLRAAGGGRRDRSVWHLYSNGAIVGDFDLVTGGRYRLRARVAGQQAGGEVVRMALVQGPASLLESDVPGERVPRTMEVTLTLEPGRHSLGAAFLNDHHDPQNPDPAQRDRNAMVNWIELEGPLDRAGRTRFQRMVASACGADAIADRTARERAMVAATLERLWRRPVDAAQIDALRALCDEIDGPDASLERRQRTTLTAALVSPRFLVRLEGDPVAPSLERELDGYEIASRLSYFLWSSAPDDELREAAATGALGTVAGRRLQVARMLADPRSLALSEHFATQWLQIRSLLERRPDRTRFADVDTALLESMRLETVLFFDSFVRESRPLGELISADDTFLNDVLAEHYGIAGVVGGHMRRVSLRSTAGLREAGLGGRLDEGTSDPAACGILRHGSVLLATSNPTRTSPVKRGKWVLEALLDDPPPPAPPGVPALPKDGEERGETSLRALLERHRADPNCAGCHRRLDPLGFALESFDAVGRFRLSDDGAELDVRGELPSGRALNGPEGLRDYLLEGNALLRGLTRHLLTYALGRGLDDGDDPLVEEILAATREQPTIARLIQAIVESKAFLRRGAPGGGA